MTTFVFLVPFILSSLMQADCELVKIDIHCHIQGDVLLECISLDEDLEREEMMFRVMFNTAFIRSNILMLNRDEIDILWDAKDRFPKDFRAEVQVSFFTCNCILPCKNAEVIKINYCSFSLFLFKRFFFLKWMQRIS